MQSPFPGMDPFLEGHLWPDFHNTLSVYLKAQLVPRVSPKYLVQTAVYTVMDTEMEEDIGIMYPDVSLLREDRKVKEARVIYEGGEGAAVTPPTVIIREMPPVEIEIPVIEIRDMQHRRLVTAIEILSPVNKRKPGLAPYREKRKRLHESGVHLLEIDLLRRGQRIIRYARLPQSDYMVSLWRGHSVETQIWAFGLRDMLPVVPVPLMEEDEDVFLDLGKACKEVYQMSGYRAAIDYTEAPPPPSLPPEDRQWMMQLIGE